MKKETTTTKKIVVLDRGIKDTKDQLLGGCCFGPIFPVWA